MVGYLLDGEIGKSGGIAAECRAKHQQGWLGSDILAQRRKLLLREGLRGRVDEVAFRGVTLLPIEAIARGVGETLESAERLGEHDRVIDLADDFAAVPVKLDQRGRKAIIAE